MASGDWALSLALAAALVAAVLRLARARGALERTAVALFCATVVWGGLGRLGVVRIGAGFWHGPPGGSWLTRVGGDVLLVGGLVALARVRSRLAAPAATSGGVRVGRALSLPIVLLGYVLREPTIPLLAGWGATSLTWVVGSSLRARN